MSSPNQTKPTYSRTKPSPNRTQTKTPTGLFQTTLNCKQFQLDIILISSPIQIKSARPKTKPNPNRTQTETQTAGVMPY